MQNLKCKKRIRRLENEFGSRSVAGSRKRCILCVIATVLHDSGVEYTDMSIDFVLINPPESKVMSRTLLSYSMHSAVTRKVHHAKA